MANSAKEQLGVELEEPQRAEAVAIPPQVEEQGAETRPEWLPENFSTPEEFVASYREAQALIREQGESQRRMEDQLNQLTILQQQQQYQEQQQPQANNEVVQAQINEALERDPVGTMLWLAGQVADQRIAAAQPQMQLQNDSLQAAQNDLIANTANNVMAARYPDWDKYGDKVGEAIDRNPALMPIEMLSSLDSTTTQLDAIYKQVKYDDLAATVESGQFTQSAEQMKRQAQSLQGQGGRPPAESPTDERINALKAAAKQTSYAAFRNG